MATNELIYIKRHPSIAKNWVVGIDDSVTIEGVSQKSINSVDLQSSIESFHVKDADGITRLSGYLNKSNTVTVSAVYEGTAPEAGDTMTCGEKTFQITNVTVRRQPAEGICTITAEHFAGWVEESAA